MDLVGVVGVQGDFDKHLDAFRRAGVPPEALRLVKTPAHLEGVRRVVVPGGESTTVGMLMDRFGLGSALIDFARQGRPVWGTCMGMILMADRVEGRQQYSLGLLDVTVRRNAFGAQVHSFEDEVHLEPLGRTVTGVFIRAPIVVEHGPSVDVVGLYDGKVVAVKQGNLVGTSFHPELTDDTGLHEWFLGL
ncbi:MAG: pyridoxal 5'-phosphate synthase glutaminase subunit PdxT [Fimbriimonadaceae bacterium]|nr:pyridoxal 5'-phosphate synthase glutaminase subunit PdxT [Fimbriimonadaceae bacterium]